MVYNTELYSNKKVFIHCNIVFVQTTTVGSFKSAQSSKSCAFQGKSLKLYLYILLHCREISYQFLGISLYTREMNFYSCM